MDCKGCYWRIRVKPFCDLDGFQIRLWDRCGHPKRVSGNKAANCALHERVPKWALRLRKREMRDEPEPIELTVQLIKRSPKAMLVSDGRVRAWLPLSQIESWETENEAKRIYRARIPEWLAKTKGLI